MLDAVAGVPQSAGCAFAGLAFVSFACGRISISLVARNRPASRAVVAEQHSMLRNRRAQQRCPCSRKTGMPGSPPAVRVSVSLVVLGGGGRHLSALSAARAIVRQYSVAMPLPQRSADAAPFSRSLTTSSCAVAMAIITRSSFLRPLTILLPRWACGWRWRLFPPHRDGQHSTRSATGSRRRHRPGLAPPSQP